jgi:hypothetical protein
MSSPVDQLLKVLRGGPSGDSQEMMQALGMQALMSEMQMANSITSRITNKLVSDVIDEVFSMKRRHKVTHV